MAEPEAIYTCPMHPEVRQQGPGACPFCGMALEPAIVTLDEGPNLELIDMTRRFWIAAALGLPVMVVRDGGDDRSGRGSRARSMCALADWIQLALATPVVLWAGWPFFTRAWDSIVNRSPNMFTLIGVGVGAAYGYSVAATVAPGLFPDGFRMHGRVEPYFDTAVVITALVLLGQVLEIRAREPHVGGAQGTARARAEDRAQGARADGERRCRSPTSTSAISCACVPANACRWTASSSRDARPWTSRW